MRTSFIRRNKEDIHSNTSTKNTLLGIFQRKSGKMPFTLSEVLRAEKEGKLLIYGRDLIALWETDDKRYLYVILRKKDLRIVTAYRIGRKQYLKILKY